MGWAYGTNRHGREIGYGVEATCDQDGCDEKIDRGLGYVCGDMHDGDENCCGGYFCAAHLYMGAVLPAGQMCEACADRYRRENPEAVEAAIAEWRARR